MIFSKRRFEVAIRYRAKFPGGHRSGTWRDVVGAKHESGAIREALHRFADKVELWDGAVLEVRVEEGRQ